MFNFLDKIRKKPARVKKQIAFFTAFSFAGIIFVVWLSVIYPDFVDTQEKQSKISSIQANPTDNFTSFFSQGMTGIKDQYQKLKEAMTAFSSGPTYYSASSSPEIPAKDDVSTTTQN